VVIAESTRRLLGNLFDLHDFGTHDLKGLGGQVRAWSVLRPASVESRFEALHASGLTELVGREEELEILLRRWSKAKSGEGQAVLLSGEAGIGKSRLTAALRIGAAPRCPSLVRSSYHAKKKRDEVTAPHSLGRLPIQRSRSNPNSRFTLAL
jgi:AAA ATPase domain